MFVAALPEACQPATLGTMTRRHGLTVARLTNWIRTKPQSASAGSGPWANALLRTLGLHVGVLAGAFRRRRALFSRLSFDFN
jgi:hypothetical protein